MDANSNMQQVTPQERAKMRLMIGADQAMLSKLMKTERDHSLYAMTFTASEEHFKPAGYAYLNV